MADNEVMDVELDELNLQSGDSIVGRSVGDVVADWPHTMLIVAVKTAGGKMIFRPDPHYQLAEKDTIILLGESTGIAHFLERPS